MHFEAHEVIAASPTLERMVTLEDEPSCAEWLAGRNARTGKEPQVIQHRILHHILHHLTSSHLTESKGIHTHTHTYTQNHSPNYTTRESLFILFCTSASSSHVLVWGSVVVES